MRTTGNGRRGRVEDDRAVADAVVHADAGGVERALGCREVVDDESEGETPCPVVDGTPHVDALRGDDGIGYSASTQSPSAIAARGLSAGPSTARIETLGVEHLTEVPRGADGIVDDRADERDLGGPHDRLADEGRLGCTPARVVALTLAVPLEQQAGRVTRPREREPLVDARRHLHPAPLRALERDVEIGDLHRHRVHPAAESLQEAAHRRRLAERLADLDRVVGDPRHAAAPLDAGCGHLVVVQHAAAEEPRQRVEDRVVARGPSRWRGTSTGRRRSRSRSTRVSAARPSTRTGAATPNRCRGRGHPSAA